MRGQQEKLKKWSNVHYSRKIQNEPVIIFIF